MKKIKPQYPVSDPLPYINDERNLPAGVVQLGELSEKESKKYAFYTNQVNHLSIVYMLYDPFKKDGSFLYYQCDFPMKFLIWFPNTLEKFRLPPDQSPYRGFMTPEENVDGEMLAISRKMAADGKNKPGYGVYNFSRHNDHGHPAKWDDTNIESFWPMSMTWTEEFLFEKGLLDLIKDLARKAFGSHE
jgi:hypothetical protein